MSRRASYKRGLAAESVAAWILRAKGYRILARRYRTPVGEVDLIARRGKVIAFVEVKARATMDDALASVSLHGRARITRAAEHYLMRAGAGDPVLRFDVIALAPPWKWRHVMNAW